MVLTNQHFDQVRSLALRLAGIELRDRHRALFCTRCRRIGIHELPQLEIMLREVEDGDPESSASFIGLVTTQHTSFFRHPLHFDEATRHALRAVGKRGRALIWCAGAATGEEPFSLAMALLEAFGPRPIPVRILATDVDQSALAIAQSGEYSELAVRSLSAERRDRFFRRTTEGRAWTLESAPRGIVELGALNLISQPWPITGPIDVIFCRNVLMYLETGYRLTILRGFASLLAPDGLLMLDPAEHLGLAEHLFTPGSDGVYSCRPVHQSQRPVISAAVTMGT